MNDRILCLAHLFGGLALVITGGMLTAYGHGGVGADVMIGAGATLLPTAPSGLLRSKTTGSLINDTIAAMQAGAVAAGHPITTRGFPAPGAPDAPSAAQLEPHPIQPTPPIQQGGPT